MYVDFRFEQSPAEKRRQAFAASIFFVSSCITCVLKSPRPLDYCDRRTENMMMDEQGIESFVGKNTGYYRDKWKKFYTKPGAMASFNLAACLGQVIWLAYRKLYVPLFWAVVVSVAYVWLSISVEGGHLISENLSAAWSWFVSLLFLAVFGFFGNYLYWGKFLKIERRAASMQSDRDAQLQFIGSKGGTSPVGAWLVVLVLLMPVLWAGYWGVYQASRVDYSAFVFDAMGPLTLAEVQANFLSFMDEPLDDRQQECVFREVEGRARAAGDPETLDPATVEFLPADEWDRLDLSGKRIILTQAIVTKAFFVCNRSGGQTAGHLVAKTDTNGTKEVITAGDPRFSVFELSNSAGDGTFASPNGTVLLSFLAKDSRYCRSARFSSDYTVVLACRNEHGWEIEATSSFAPGDSTVATVFGGGDMKEVAAAIQALQPGADLLNEREIIEAARKGWR